MNNYKEDLQTWVARQTHMTFVNRVSEIIPDTPKREDLKVGDKVYYTNGRGCRFGPYEIVAISKDDKLWAYGLCVYLDKESYWFPVRPSELTRLRGRRSQ